jgi:hypothetical protein
VSARPSSRAGRRASARRLLERNDLAAAARAGSEPGGLRVLESLLLDPAELVRWRAAEALGRAAALRARLGLEPVRELLRRTLWLMNDESGGIAWQGPQVLGAVLAEVPRLVDEFGPLLAGLVDEEPFRVGARWALWRLASAQPQLAALAAPALAASLADPATPRSAVTPPGP